MGQTVDFLTGAVVQKLCPVCDYWQLMTDGPMVSIYNPSGYDTIRAYTILAETPHPPSEPDCLNNITIQFSKTPLKTERNI